MRWVTEMNGQGCYWWKAETPLGPVYAEFYEGGADVDWGWYAYWHPYGDDKETPIARVKTQDDAKAAAGAWIKSAARKKAKRLLAFAS